MNEHHGLHTSRVADRIKGVVVGQRKERIDAARKRDEVATRLDQQTITAARLAAQTFNPQREPEEAISIKGPPGGWDRATAAAQPTKPKPRPRATTP